jgi:Zn-dependent protease/predicted transcriptional regulator
VERAGIFEIPSIMKGSIRIATVAGIDILLHWTFSLLLVGLVAFYAVQGATFAAAGLGMSLVMALFACVILHELGHALMARNFSVPTRDITLYPIGGVARLQRIPEEPMKEFWIAIAGPAVNVVIAAILFAVIIVGGLTIRPGNILDPRIGFFATLMWLNIALVVFNLLPAFPMDGGRVLRALLAVRLEYTRATEIAASIGQGMAILFGLLGLISFNPILIFIALFVYLGAQQESRHAMLRAATQGIPVRRAMLTRYSTLDPDDTLATAVEKLLRGSDQDFPVVRYGKVLGLLTRKRLMQGLAEQGQETRVGSLIDAECFTVDDTAMLEEAFQLMRESACNAVPVVRGGELVGVLTLENIGELMMVSSALKKSGSASGAEVSRAPTP